MFKTNADEMSLNITQALSITFFFILEGGVGDKSPFLNITSQKPKKIISSYLLPYMLYGNTFHIPCLAVAGHEYRKSDLSFYKHPSCTVTTASSESALQHKLNTNI